jgi:hypothetical protein
MKYESKICKIKKIAKAIILVPLIITVSLFIVVFYSEFTGTHLSIGGNYPIIILFVNIGLFILIIISLYELSKNMKVFKK